MKDKIKEYSKCGLMLTYPGIHNDGKVYQYNRLIEEFEKLGIKIDKLKVDEVIISIKDDKPNLEIDKYDFCIQLVKDKYIDTFLKNKKIRSFNTYSAIDNCDDKMMTFALLAENKVKMPLTISGITNIGIENLKNETISEKHKDYVERKLGYPFIIKKSNSKGGRDIYKIDNQSSFNDIYSNINGNDYLFQEFISISVGKDIRVVVVGGKVVGSFMRINENDFRSNIVLGGKAVSYAITPEHKKVAEKIAKLLKLDYCSVDFFVTEEPIVCEVNADPALYVIEEFIDKNVAEIYAKHVVNQIYK